MCTCAKIIYSRAYFHWLKDMAEVLNSKQMPFYAYKNKIAVSTEILFAIIAVFFCERGCMGL